MADLLERGGRRGAPRAVRQDGRAAPHARRARRGDPGWHRHRGGGHATGYAENGLSPSNVEFNEVVYVDVILSVFAFRNEVRW